MSIVMFWLFFTIAVQQGWLTGIAITLWMMAGGVVSVFKLLSFFEEL